MSEQIIKQSGYRLRTAAVRASMVVAFVVATVFIVAAPAQAQNEVSSRPQCREFVLPVSLDPGGTKDQRIDVTYCTPKVKGHHSKRTPKVVVTTPGATYTKHYFDWQQWPHKYSYAQATAKDGIAALTYTPVGRVAGKSTYPASTELTLARNAHVLRQVVDYASALGYRDIYSMGHSVGAGVALAHASTDERVDGLILTGYTHRSRDPNFGPIHNYPANQDPKFQGLGLDNGYGTTRPGHRNAFYGPAAHESVINFDELHKDVISTTLLGGYAADQAAPATSNVSRTIVQPVLMVVGDKDKIFCTDNGQPNCDNKSGMTALEEPFFPQAASFRYVGIGSTGHDLTTATTAPYSAYVINEWIKQN